MNSTKASSFQKKNANMSKVKKSKKWAGKKKQWQKKKGRIPKAPYGVKRNSEIKSIDYITAPGNETDGNGLHIANFQGLSFVGGTLLPTGTCINVIRQGAAPNERVGRQVKIKEVYLRYAINQNWGNAAQTAATAAGLNSNPPEKVRFLMVWDASPNASATVVPYATIFPSSNFFQNIDLNQKNRFLILYDQVHCFSGSTAILKPVSEGDNMNPSGMPFVYRKIKINRPTVFGSNGGTYADITTGSLLIFVVKETPITKASEPACSNWVCHYSARVNYEDL